MSTATSKGGAQRDQVEALVRRTLYEYLPDAYMGRTGAGLKPLPAAPRLVANISARHIHLNRGTLEALFGEGAQLSVLKPLYQEGAFASEQTVTLFGPRKQMIADVRILGPLREYNQVELAFSDARFLGVDAPHSAQRQCGGDAGLLFGGTRRWA